LANRVKPLIPNLIHPDQTGFVSGRNIAENFIYAADIVQSCHKRKAAAIAFKIDFRKAFDSVSWDSLRKILKAKGFPNLWCDLVDPFKWCPWRMDSMQTGVAARRATLPFPVHHHCGCPPAAYAKSLF
jgi:hypothetical protein